MQWPHLTTACIAAITTGISGLWFYLMTRRRRYWRTGGLCICIGFSATAGFAFASVLCEWFCHGEQVSGFVLGLCMLCGLGGFNPKLATKLREDIMSVFPRRNGHDGDNGQQPTPSTPDSDGKLF